MEKINLKLPMVCALALLFSATQVVLGDWEPGDPNKWVQLPDLRPEGIDIRIDNSDGKLRTIADDFECTEPGPITDVHLWGSWRDDRRGQINKIQVSIYSDDPRGPGGSDPENTYSKPDKLLWQRDFEPHQFTERLYARVDGGEWWWDPVNQLLIKGGDTEVWQINIDVCGESPFCDPFNQLGSPEKPIIYWLAARISTTQGEFGWKTRRWPEHYNDDAVMAIGSELPLFWNELRYPEGHPYYKSERDSIDMAFVITTEGRPEHDLGDAPDSSNTFITAPMTAYPPAVIANYPTVYLTGSPPYGPLHLQPRALAFLGQAVSLENEADVGPDEDGMNNIDPPNDKPDMDKHDDGVIFPLVMPHCQPTKFEYVVTVVNPLYRSVRVNVWCDWNRDGDWNDTLQCPSGSDVPEWAVQNQQIDLSDAGVFTFTTPPFLSWHPPGGANQRMWMRITLSVRMWDSPAGTSEGGSGPQEGYQYGETEDYYFMPEIPQPDLDFGDAPDGWTAPGYPTLAINNGARHKVVPGFHLGGTIRVSQESGPGTGDFDDNVLGYVMPYMSSLSTAEYYQYGTPYGASFNGPEPPLTSGRSHLFVARTTDGPALFVVHDKPEDGSGGTTAMHWTVSGDTVGLLQGDDPGETVTISGGGTIIDSSHSWAPCCTDGMALGSLDGQWTMIGAFTNNIADTGMNQWHVYSVDNSSIPLVLEKDRRVRLDYYDAVDTEPDGQPDPDALGDDKDTDPMNPPPNFDDEDGVIFITRPLIPGRPARVNVIASADGYLHAWVDFNGDGSWAEADDHIFAATPLTEGMNPLVFHVPMTATSNITTFSRFRFTTHPVDLNYDGPAEDGEVEDHIVKIGENCGIKWIQVPDETENGIDIRVDSSDGTVRTLADDFRCTSYGLITDVHLWGSWHDDRKGEITKIHLSIHSDDPVGPDGSGSSNRHSMPDKLLWERDFLPGQFAEKLHSVVERGEYWWDPTATGELIPQGDTEIWRIDIDIDPTEAFLQEGSPEKPVVYWLDVQVETEAGEFGWKTRRWPDHYNDDAVYVPVAGPALIWKELRYPLGHPYHKLRGSDFEDLTLGATYNVGDTFTTSGILVTVRPFQWNNGTWYSGGYAQVQNSGNAGGSGNEIWTNNVNLDFDLPSPLRNLALLFGEYGGNLNIQINGDFRNISSMADINGLTIGGVDVTVIKDSGNTGSLHLAGTINQFFIGGQEFVIDNLKFNTIDMAFAITTKSDYCSSCPDLDCNGMVNFRDLAIFADKWLQKCP